MRRRILTLSWTLSFLAAAHLLAMPLQAQLTDAKCEVKHYGYSATDKLFECIQQVYGKPVSSIIDIRGWVDSQFPCPSTREGIDDLLQTKAPLLKVQPYGVRLFETPDWVYLIPLARFDSPRGYKWKSIKIETKVEADSNNDDSMDEADAKPLVPEILKLARMIPLQPEDAAKQDEAEIKIRLRFYETNLGPNAPDAVITIIDQRNVAVAGRLVYGEMRGGEYTMLWDSPLFDSVGSISFQDVSGDRSKKIVWDSRICGARDCILHLVVFDKDGREITRQRKCVHGYAEWYDETDGVCAIEGSDIKLTAISPYPGDRDPHKPVDIVVQGFGEKEKRHIFTLENGMYVLSKLSESAISNIRKVKSQRDAAAMNEQGMKLMKEGNYADAEKSFREASHTVNSENPLYDNNAGYAYYKAGNYKYSIGVLGTAIMVDPKRAIAYLNRGDAFVALHYSAKGRQDAKDFFKNYCMESSNWCIAEARKDYEKYLELAPDSKAAPDVKKKLAALPSSP